MDYTSAPTQEVPELRADGVSHPSLATSARDACASCGAPLAADQRYCVECGERRGEPRLPFMDGRPRSAAEAPVPRRGRRLRMSASGTLIAGVGTLLLALGVGVLIGRAGHTSTTSNKPVQFVTVPGAGAGTGVTGANGATAAASTGTKNAGAKSKKGGSKTHKTSSIANQTKQKPGSNLPPAVVKMGSPGHGMGYKNGKFTGDFFGP
jgi:hypothetical protein